MIFSVPHGYYLFVTYLLAGTVGLCVGSFLNVVIYRVPRHMSLASPPSHCPHCGYRLKWYDNIPVLSYCLLGGKCRSCKSHISFRYTAVEIANTLLWLLCVCRFSDNVLWMASAMVISSAALAVFWIDKECMLIPDRFQIILGVCGIGCTLTDTQFSALSHLIGGAAAFAVFCAVALIGEKTLGREALGGGDVKLAGVCGLILGWERMIAMMLIASVCGSIVMLIRKKRSENHQSEETPFAPFLTAGLAIALFFGTEIIDGYIRLITPM